MPGLPQASDKSDVTLRTHYRPGYSCPLVEAFRMMLVGMCIFQYHLKHAVFCYINLKANLLIACTSGTEDTAIWGIRRLLT
jgi:hypothetical protein